MRKDMQRILVKTAKWQRRTVTVPRHQVAAECERIRAKGWHVAAIDAVPVYRVVCHFGQDKFMPDLDAHRCTRQEYQEIWEYGHGAVCFFRGEYMTYLDLELYLTE